MQLTIRGYVVGFVCVASLAFAWLFGTRTLDVIAIAGVVVLAAGYLQLRGIDPPRLERDVPADGHVGDRGRVTLRFFDDVVEEGLERPLLATVEESVDEGLTVEEADEATAVPDPSGGRTVRIRAPVGTEPLVYDLEYGSRGRKRIGPATLAVTDVFGLFERSLQLPGTDRLTVYPERYRIAPSVRRELGGSVGTGRYSGRDEFDRLREYEPGDDLRDVHWPTTAKRDELVVAEYEPGADTERVAIAGRASSGCADEMATATTSLALALLEDGIPVTVAVPSGRVEATPDGDGERRLLELLATTNAGSMPDVDADVSVIATRSGTEIHFGDRETTFRTLRADRSTPNRPTEVGEDTPETIPEYLARADGGDERNRSSGGGR